MTLTTTARQWELINTNDSRSHFTPHQILYLQGSPNPLTRFADPKSLCDLHPLPTSLRLTSCPSAHSWKDNSSSASVHSWGSWLTYKCQACIETRSLAVSLVSSFLAVRDWTEVIVSDSTLSIRFHQPRVNDDNKQVVVKFHIRRTKLLRIIRPPDVVSSTIGFTMIILSFSSATLGAQLLKLPHLGMWVRFENKCPHV